MKTVDIVFRAASAALLIFFVAERAAVSQTLDDPQTVDKIVGSEVAEEATTAVADEGKVIAAIEKATETTATIRKTTALDKVDIVFLQDAVATEGGPPPKIEAKIEEHARQIDEMRKELEGNALLFHAIDSRQILVRDVLAVEFTGRANAVVYAAAKKQD